MNSILIIPSPLAGEGQGEGGCFADSPQDECMRRLEFTLTLILPHQVGGDGFE